ncbi:hypothetical protein IHE45_06G019600 [Dioscorea alata]|uniref:Uncharacterized protein n=1 Tax=Dioscorea alata TaxID=55571 RepID=A0ACB7VVK1_DIOAL|nr:hypothetical protein IHE45_06G019600 [Dioscorea alata]
MICSYKLLSKFMITTSFLLSNIITTTLCYFISTSPSFLPTFPTPSSSSSSSLPALSPDMMPEFPTPGRATPDTALPTITSTPSPPDPDVCGPEFAFAPSSLSSTASTKKSLLSLHRFDLGFILLVVVCMFHFFLF